MSIGSEVSRNAYVGNNTASTYSYTFGVQNEDHVRVVVCDPAGAETVLSKATHYTVTGVRNAGGGTVELLGFDDPDPDLQYAWIDEDGNLNAGYTLILRRVRPLKQQTSIRNQGRFYQETHELQFDALVEIDQQQQDQINRSVKLPESLTSNDFDPTLPFAIAGMEGRTIVTNPAGNGLALGPTVDLVASIPGLAAAAEAAAASAAASAAIAAAASAGVIDVTGLMKTDGSTAMTGNLVLEPTVATNHIIEVEIPEAVFDSYGSEIQLGAYMATGGYTTFTTSGMPYDDAMNQVAVDAVNNGWPVTITRPSYETLRFEFSLNQTVYLSSPMPLDDPTVIQAGAPAAGQYDIVGAKDVHARKFIGENGFALAPNGSIGFTLLDPAGTAGFIGDGSSVGLYGPQIYIVPGASGVMVTGHIDMTDKQVRNLADGSLSTDAVNKGQLDAVSSALTDHEADTTAIHGIADTAALATKTGAETLTNKDIDGGTASNSNRITLPKASSATLAGLTRKQGTIAYDTDLNKAVIDTGSTLVPVGSGGGGSSLTWVESVNAPMAAVDVYQQVYVYSQVVGISQYLYGLVLVPASYVTGTPITLKIAPYSKDTASATMNLISQTYLIRPGLTAINSIGGSYYESTNAAVSVSASTVDIPQSMTLDLTNSSGQINGVSVAAGHLLRIGLTRQSDTSTLDVYLPAYTAELLFT